jgi:hypothetical protein
VYSRKIFMFVGAAKGPTSYTGSVLSLYKVNRRQMGSYLCIASNEAGCNTNTDGRYNNNTHKHAK